MRWSSAAAIYILFWAFSVFLVLPWGVRTTHEVGARPVPGQADSAPHHFPLARVAVRVTVVATVLFALFQLNYRYGWISTRSMDFLLPANPPA